MALSHAASLGSSILLRTVFSLPNSSYLYYTYIYVYPMENTYLLHLDSQPQTAKTNMQQQISLGVALEYSNPIIGLRFTPKVVLHGAPEHFLQFGWYRLLNDKKVNCHVHKLEKAIVQCRTCVLLNLRIEDSFHCSTECYINTWECHRERHSTRSMSISDDDKNRENHRCDLENDSVAKGSTITVDQDGRLWLKVGSLRTYVPSRDDFGCILRLKTVVVSCQIVSKEDVIVTDRVVVLPATHPRTMIGIEPLARYNSEYVPTRFRVLSYNILADMNVPLWKYNYCPKWSLNWAYRRQNLLREIISYKADILCLQEVQLDHFENFLKPKIEQHGYSVTYKGREPKIYTSEGYKAYGCATFYNINRFRKVMEYTLEFGKCAQAQLDALQPTQREIGRKRLLKDNIAIMTILEAVHAVTTLDKLNSRFCVVNTHICASEEFKDVKLWQVATLVDEVEKIVGVIPVLLCMDLNCRPGSAPYDLLVHGKVDHNHLEFPYDPIGIFCQSKLSHNLLLSSAYSKMILEIGKSQVTHFNKNFKGTLDYIFYPEGKLRLEGHLELLQVNNPLPSPQWSSDHIALMADFEFV